MKWPSDEYFHFIAWEDHILEAERCTAFILSSPHYLYYNSTKGFVTQSKARHNNKHRTGKRFSTVRNRTHSSFLSSPPTESGTCYYWTAEKKANTCDRAYGFYLNLSHFRSKLPPFLSLYWLNRVPVLTDIRVATSLPPTTAIPVHNAWPSKPPIMVPARDSLQTAV